MHANHDRRAALNAIRRVLAADCACDEVDFDEPGVTIVPARELPARRRFPFLANPLLVATMGVGAVVSAHPARLEWLRAQVGSLDREDVFAATTIARLARFIEPAGQSLIGPSLKHACSRAELRPAPAPRGVDITLIDERGVSDLYRHPGFDNALAYRIDGLRPDVLAAVATRADTLIGVAGVSADCDVLWQIGVDVVATARGAGVGRALVSLLTDAILATGRVPYYATSASNIASRALTASVGYWPAWVELRTQDR